MFWPISSAVGIRLWGPSGLYIHRWQELCFVVGGHRRSICSLQVSTRSFPYTVPLSRIPSLRGCVSSSLGQPGCVRVSTLSPSQKGGGSSQRDTQSLFDLGCPPLAGDGVVRRPSNSTDPTTSGAGTGCRGSPTSTGSTMASTP